MLRAMGALLPPIGVTIFALESSAGTCAPSRAQCGKAS